MKQAWQLISDNAGWIRPASVVLSTVEMPRIKDFDFGYRYESCLFTGSDSEVLERYNTVSEAVRGHRELTRRYGLTEQ
jgi:spore coat polysaccharide biosynthesis protein SpsF (cytidylyltransferase family)